MSNETKHTKRWNAPRGATIHESEKGEFVLYSDYAELEAQLAACKDRYCLGCDIVLKPTPLKDQYAQLEAQNKELREALEELVATVKGECPSLLNEDSGGSSHLISQIDKALSGGG